MAVDERAIEEETAGPVFTHRELTLIMSGLILAMLLASLDHTIVATSLSTMARDLRGWQLMPWVVSPYLVASPTTTPLCGRLTDLDGRPPPLLISISLILA